MPASAASGFIKAGAGTMTLTNSSTYSGPTTIASGTLRLGSAGGGGAGTITLGNSSTWYPAAITTASYTTGSYTIGGSTSPDVMVVEVSYRVGAQVIPTSVTYRYAQP